MKHFSSSFSCVLLTAALLTACGGESDDQGPSDDGAQATAPVDSASGDSTVSAQASCALPDFQQTVLARVNQARASSRQCGSQSFAAAASLAWNERLFAAAAGHAEDMARNDYFSHDGRDGRTFSQRISDAGYTWSAAGENIAAGQADVAQVVTAWLDSPGHCTNIMSSSFTEVAVACVRDDASTHIQYWTMSLGRPR